MNTKVLKASLAGVAAVALLAGGGTYASWSDFSIDEDNTVGAGTLTITAGEDGGTGPTSQFDNVRLAPGQDKDEWTKIVSNDGDSVPGDPKPTGRPIDVRTSRSSPTGRIGRDSGNLGPWSTPGSAAPVCRSPAWPSVA